MKSAKFLLNKRTRIKMEFMIHDYQDWICEVIHVIATTKLGKGDGTTGNCQTNKEKIMRIIPHTQSVLATC